MNHNGTNTQRVGGLSPKPDGNNNGRILGEEQEAQDTESEGSEFERSQKQEAEGSMQPHSDNSDRNDGIGEAKSENLTTGTSQNTQQSGEGGVKK